MSLRSPLGQAKGLGSAKEGTSHFWHQRLTALLMIPLVLWIGFSVAALPSAHADLVAWVQQPLVTAGLVLLVISLFYHAQLGLQVFGEAVLVLPGLLFAVLRHDERDGQAGTEHRLGA